MRKLSKEEIEKISKKTRTPKVRQIDTSVRDTDTWFKLDHEWGLCEVPEHDGSTDREHPLYPGQFLRGRFVADIGGVKMCRYCFLAGA